MVIHVFGNEKELTEKTSDLNEILKKDKNIYYQVIEIL